jgi:hypothetical protein
MKRSYLIAHWMLTLLIAPFTSQAIEYFYGASPHQVAGLLEVYPISLLFSVVFSLPTFLVYLACFYFLSRRATNLAVAKLVLILVSVLGIYITEAIIKGSMSRDIIIAYSVTSIILGMLLKIGRPPLEKQEKSIPT